MSRQGQARQRTIEHVREFWNAEADEWGDNPQVTIRDHFFRLIEIESVRNVIGGSKRVLNIGCGSGFATLFYAEVVETIVGADFAERMIERAKAFLYDRDYFEHVMNRFAPGGPPALKGNVRFEVGDVLALEYPPASFDAVVGERLLINLPERRFQDQALAEMARVARAGGRVVSAEVTVEGHQRVDWCRELFGLPELEKYWHNSYVEEDHFREEARGLGLELRATERFETYQFLTKVVHPLVVAPAEPTFLSGFNEAARWASRRYPTYESVGQVGIGPFLRERFRPMLAQTDPTLLAAFDRVANEVSLTDPDFSGCSHQVTFLFEK